MRDTALDMLLSLSTSVQSLHQLQNLKFVIHVRRVIAAVAARGAHSGGRHLRRQRRVVLGHAPFLVAAKSIAPEIGICLIERRLCLFGLLGRRLGELACDESPGPCPPTLIKPQM